MIKVRFWTGTKRKTHAEKAVVCHKKEKTKQNNPENVWFRGMYYLKIQSLF